MNRLLALSLTLLFLLAGPAFAAPVDINTADAPALAQAIDGVGPTRAEAIVAYRKQNGPFASVDDLARVKGVGPVVIERNRDRLTTGKE